MKLVTIETLGEVRVAALLGDGRSLIDLRLANDLAGGAEDHRFRDMQAFIEAGAAALDSANRFLDQPPDEARVPIERARLLAPLPRPAQIRCFSVFEEHARQSARVMMKIMARNTDDPEKAIVEFAASGRFEIPPVFYERPLYYKGNRFSVIGTGSDVVWPEYSGVIDYELEIAAVIGKQGRDIAAGSAHSHIYGYSVFNDLTARDEQSREMVAPLGPAKGKDFDGGNVLGPCIVTADEIPDPVGLRVTARVNGQTWTDTTCDGMAHSFSEMLAYVSRSETVFPGEIFLSGCVGGGCGMEQERYLSRGDSIELEVEGIGKLKNRIV